jgi:Bacterial Ig-like domain
MRTEIPLLLALLALGFYPPLNAQEVSLESAPPVVVSTTPTAGSVGVDPGLAELRVSFSKPMQDGSWSWSTWGEDTFPEMTDKPRYLEDGKTCVLPVKLQPGKFYATWLNSSKFRNFKDASGNPAVPYLLTFRTADTTGGSGASRQAEAPSQNTATASPSTIPALNADQQAVLQWSDRQFRSFFDRRNFTAWSAEDRDKLEASLLDALQGPRSREYYQAINSLGALKSPKAVQPLLAIAAERREKDNRDRWMAIRALGMIGEKSVVPELIHLVYHGNVNTRWWAQIALVQLTGVNFANDWQAWGKWWSNQGGRPDFNPEFVVWYKDPDFSDPAKLQETLKTSDAKFLESIQK